MAEAQLMRIKRWVSVVAAILLMGLAIPSVGFAQSPQELSDEERVTLGRLFSAARKAYEEKDLETSIAKLQAAYEVFPEPSILYKIAEMQEELGQPAAIGTYEIYLESDPDTANRGMVLSRIQRLKDAQPKQATTARVTLETAPAGARIYIGDMEERRGVTPLELELEPGTYTIKLVKDGYEEGQRTLEVVAGELRTFDFTLREIQKVEQSAPVPEPPKETGPATATWVFATLSGASAIAGTVFFVLANDRQSQLDEWDDSKDEVTRPPEYKDTLDQEKTYRTLTWVAAGSTLAFATTSVILFFATRGETELEDSNVSVSFTDRSINVMTRW